MYYRTPIVALGFLGLGLSALAASGTETKSQAPPLAAAKIERPAAEKIALAKVPQGVIKEGELEQEHGHLVWSFDIAPPQSQDIVEVQVDAIDGSVVSVETETPADQAKEAAQDKAKEHRKKT